MLKWLSIVCVVLAVVPFADAEPKPVEPFGPIVPEVFFEEDPGGPADPVLIRGTWSARVDAPGVSWADEVIASLASLGTGFVGLFLFAVWMLLTRGR